MLILIALRLQGMLFGSTCFILQKYSYSRIILVLHKRGDFSHQNINNNNFHMFV